MSNEEKIEKAIELLRNAGIRDEKICTKEVYENMKYGSLYDLAEEISMFINLIYDLRDVLEGEQ